MEEDYEKIANNILDKMNNLEQENTELRFEQIDKAIGEGNMVNFSELTKEEIYYVHSKIHFYFQMKNPPVSIKNLSKMHLQAMAYMDDHTAFDRLDTMQF